MMMLELQMLAKAILPGIHDRLKKAIQHLCSTCDDVIYLVQDLVCPFGCLTAVMKMMMMMRLCAAVFWLKI